ncbi:MAG: RES domain-containing protein, partial [Bryobacteraceae bacterium]
MSRRCSSRSTKEWSPDLVLWRISNHADLAGIGGLRCSARWHSQGHRVVYLAWSPSAALIEAMVHLEFP